MGTEQILRVARLTLGLAALSAAVAATTAHAESAGPERVVIVDIRPDAEQRQRSRQALAGELDRAPGIAAVPRAQDPDSELARALAGRSAAATAEREAAASALEQAEQAYAGSDCRAAESLARGAVHTLAALQARAAPGDTAASLKRAYAYLLLCAHGRGDSDAAMLAARRLSQLGVDSPPPGVSSLIWSLYPALDATANTHIVELDITSEPAGAVVWFDHQRIGAAPAQVFAAEGEHLVAAWHAETGRAIARDLIVTRGTGEVALTLAGGSSAWHATARQVAAWQSGAAAPSGRDMAALLRALDARFAVVLDREQTVYLWSLAPGDDQARPLGQTTMAQPEHIVAAVRARALRWERAGPDPEMELLRDGDVVRTDEGSSKPTRWWVYATAIGAVALGAGIILASDLARDRQRIELTWP